MGYEINERWLQFAFINLRGNLNKTALRFPFHTSLNIDDEIPVTIAEKAYVFTCVAKEAKSNNDGTIDETYVVITNHQ